ncbi:ABC transporter permease [Thermoflavimicrobium daqui]|jgi:putative ABC transport system permease protein|uniref:Putative hemin transport system permease protein HrtB n=1 Tax=Thermoflavimicrobium daqui TaxID=2137476 RepID=A0A364K4I8_9BACL|nr:ABC transporter permease [Thermoflavimicrobium daqui]RAL24179.1 ABC transporter permease [Thermoflavimicrobium daqui]
MFLALRELKFSKLRYFLIGFIMILIAWLVFIISGLANGLSSDNASALQNMKADHFVIQPDAENKLNRSQITDEQWKEIQKQTSIHASAPLGLKILSVTKMGTKDKMDITIFATDASGILAPIVVEGNQFNNTTKQEIVVDQSLKQEGIQLGDWIQDPETEQKWKVVGFTEGQTFSHSPVIFMNLKDWESLIHTNPQQKKIYYSAIALQIENNQVANLKNEVKDMDVITKDEALQNIPGYKEEQGSLNMMIAFLFVIASFVQAVFFYVITLQKTNQFGVLKAIGAKTSYLARSLIGQVILLTIVAILLSIGFTYGTQQILPASVPFKIETETFILFSGLLLVVSVLGSLLSLYRIAKVDAVEAIGRAE